MTKEEIGEVKVAMKKPIINYVLAIVTHFNMGKKKVVIKARGNAISRAVDSAELVRRAFLQDLKIENIEIGTETIKMEGRTRNISTMEITLVK